MPSEDLYLSLLETARNHYATSEDLQEVYDIPCESYGYGYLDDDLKNNLDASLLQNPNVPPNVFFSLAIENPHDAIKNPAFDLLVIENPLPFAEENVSALLDLVKQTDTPLVLLQMLQHHKNENIAEVVGNHPEIVGDLPKDWTDDELADYLVANRNFFSDEYMLSSDKNDQWQNIIERELMPDWLYTRLSDKEQNRIVFSAEPAFFMYLKSRHLGDIDKNYSFQNRLLKVLYLSDQNQTTNMYLNHWHRWVRAIARRRQANPDWHFMKGQ
jgi:hypothetical protein